MGKLKVRDKWLTARDKWKKSKEKATWKHLKVKKSEAVLCDKLSRESGEQEVKKQKVHR